MFRLRGFNMYLVEAQVLWVSKVGSPSTPPSAELHFVMSIYAPGIENNELLGFDSFCHIFPPKVTMNQCWLDLTSIRL